MHAYSFENGLRVPDELCAHEPGPSTITQHQRQRGMNSSSASGSPRGYAYPVPLASLRDVAGKRAATCAGFERVSCLGSHRVLGVAQ